jgi:nucleotide-binding universal stress UspA family protein
MQGFQRIVVGFEDGARGMYAARQGVAVARQCGGEVVLVHVGSDAGGVARMCHQVAGSGVPVSYSVAHGDVVAALVAVAQARDADLIVVGTHGRSGARRVLRGSIAEGLVRASSASVLALRGTPVVGGYERIVVGTDFSPCSLPAVPRALAVARDTAIVQVAHWWAAPASATADAATVADQRLARAELAAERGRVLLDFHHGEPRLRFRAIEGHPAEGIPDLASDEDADLIVIGSHGYRGLRRAVLGSVAEAVIRHAPCAVLVAR